MMTKGLDPTTVEEVAIARLQTGPVVGAGRALAVNALAGGGANLIKIGVQLIMLPLMAHLLGPAEFGLYALALPTISFCMILADGGLTASLAREPLESVLIWSTGFWLVLGVGIALAAFVVAWGLVLAELSHEPRVSGLMNILSISLIMISVAALPGARLTREARLAVFAGADLGSTVVGASVAVVLALSGFGARSLAVQYVTYYALRAVILNSVAFVRPRFQFRPSALISHLSVGSALLSVKTSDFLGRLIENVLYGRAFGAAGLGVYTFANQAPRFICEATSGPVWAALYAFALREKPEALQDMHVKLARLLSMIVFPAGALLSATAPQALSFILGPQWEQSGELLRLLIPFYALSVVSAQSGAVLLAGNRGWVWFGCALVLTLGRVAAVGIGARVGQTGVAVGIDLALLAYSIAMFATTGHPNGIRRLMSAIAVPVIASAVAGVGCLAAANAMGPSFLSLIFALVLGVIVYLTVLLLLQPDAIRGDLQGVRSIVRRFRKQ